MTIPRRQIQAVLGLKMRAQDSKHELVRRALGLLHFDLELETLSAGLMPSSADQCIDLVFDLRLPGAILRRPPL